MAGGQHRLDEVPAAEREKLLDELGRGALDQESVLLIPAGPASQFRFAGNGCVPRHDAPLDGKEGNIGPKLLQALECGIGADTGPSPADGVELRQTDAAAEEV